VHAETALSSCMVDVVDIGVAELSTKMICRHLCIAGREPVIVS